MKKKLFTILLCGGLLACLTGCGAEEELSSIPSDFQGVYISEQTSGLPDNLREKNGKIAYDVYKIENNVMKKKICYTSKGKAKDDCNFDDVSTDEFKTISYNIKDIDSPQSDGSVIFFNIYENNEKYAECRVSWELSNCTLKNGDIVHLSKQD